MAENSQTWIYIHQNNTILSLFHRFARRKLSLKHKSWNFWPELSSVLKMVWRPAQALKWSGKQFVHQIYESIWSLCSSYKKLRQRSLEIQNLFFWVYLYLRFLGLILKFLGRFRIGSTSPPPVWRCFKKCKACKVRESKKAIIKTVKQKNTNLPGVVCSTHCVPSVSPHYLKKIFMHVISATWFQSIINIFIIFAAVVWSLPGHAATRVKNYNEIYRIHQQTS